MSSGEEDTPLGELQAKHRKEKKDLQAKIQASKKNAKGGNKKQQKEANEAAEAMEKEMKERHDREITELKLQEVKVGGTAEASNAAKKGESEHEDDEESKFYREPTKKSKAMLRREKKEEDNRRAAAAAKEDEKNAKFGQRAKEWEVINRQLIERGLETVDIPSDGDCLFNAIADQLRQNGNGGVTGKELRRKAANFMRAHPDDFMHFIDTSEIEGDDIDHEAFKKYCKRIEGDSELWGGELEINALSRALENKIQVIQPDGRLLEFGTDYSKKAHFVLTYHQHAFALGCHYNSTRKATQKNDE
ncbi:unnamed protein product, partial [Mesorhabditis belari]|uniref:OTU domain-containing protein n=1 Tax=Mesorhabditis belari TaxID=2138241 RepID=A0AAF3EW71_9BILA